jgi:hypothetical protein
MSIGKYLSLEEVRRQASKHQLRRMAEIVTKLKLSDRHKE